MIFFCPACGGNVAATEATCPSCGFDLAAHRADSYEQKLLLALRHPVREHRMMAIQLLGELGSTAAVEPLKGMLAAESDYFTLCEVLKALAKIGSPSSAAAVAAAASVHPSKLVRQFAVRLLGKPLR